MLHHRSRPLQSRQAIFLRLRNSQFLGLLQVNSSIYLLLELCGDSTCMFGLTEHNTDDLGKVTVISAVFNIFSLFPFGFSLEHRLSFGLCIILQNSNIKFQACFSTLDTSQVFMTEPRNYYYHYYY